MVDTDALLADLAHEHEALDQRVEHLDDEAWHTPTPAEGWDVADQISHLCYFDGTARMALTDPEAFEQHKTELMQTSRDSGTPPDVALARE
ncbi:MAG: maleylpyruvate isomerase N-terminal domain-containing protein, partial [Acidimicrobiales bacterium]